MLRKFNDYIVINEITDDEIKLNLFRSVVGRPIVKYLEDQPDIVNLTSIKFIFERIEARFSKRVKKFFERIEARFSKRVKKFS